MRRDKELELIRECLGLMQRGERYCTDDETFVDVAGYQDDAAFQRERTKLFHNRLNVVGHESELRAPGDFVTCDVVGTPVIVARGEDSVIRAFINVCRHRGATVESRAAGNCRRFVCPYHAWTYGTDGRLASVRHSEGFPSLDKGETRLVELACVVAGGLVWVCPDPARSDIELDDTDRLICAEIDNLGPADSIVGRKSKVWKANWKLIVDGSLEAYHFRIAHRDTIAKFFPDNVATFEFIGDHVRSVLPRSSMAELTGTDETGWSLREHSHLLYMLAPNATILVQEGHFDLILSSPLSVSETELRVLTVAPDRDMTDKSRRYFEANHEFTCKTLDEDFELAEQIQRGLASGANKSFRFATFEGGLTQWHARLADRLAE